MGKNALRHGLAIDVRHFPELNALAESLAQEIAGEDADGIKLEKARAFADAQLDLKRIRMVRLQLMQDFQLRTPEQAEVDSGQITDEARNRRPFSLDPDRVIRALALFSSVDEGWGDAMFHERIAELALALRRVDRYERRALSKRKRAAGELQFYLK